MKHILVLIVLLYSIRVTAQNWSVINKDLKIADTLTYPTEIRIYKDRGITNYSSLFRMYEDSPGNWTAEFYEHWSKVESVAALETKKSILTSKSEMEYVYLNLCRSYIFDLPSQNDIQWKLGQRGVIKKVERIKRGKTTKEYEILSKHIMPLDGTGYSFQVKNSYKTNEFEFGTPERYKELYPEIDEPKYVCELIEIIRNEFKIWTN
jgi:hypothetical protein